MIEKRWGYYFVVILMFALFVTGCQKEDDLLIITADFTEFAIEEEVKPALIDADNKTVTVYVNDSITMRAVTVKSMQVTNNAIIEPAIAIGSVLDLSEPKMVYLKTKQDYLWRIKASIANTDSIVEDPSGYARIVVPNLDFDEWYLKDDKHWYPNRNLSAANYWWDSGNRGANILGPKNPTSPETDFVVSGTAAKLKATSVMGILASGSIFLGKYVKTSGLGAELAMGRNFNSRPVALNGYYCYHPGTIDNAKSPYANMKGKKDYCSIYIVLGDWKNRVKIDTNEGIFLDIENDPNIIAYAEISTNEDSGSEYLPFRLPLEYRNDRTPTQILIVASSCKYGDYFTGSSNSLLYIDEFSLEY